MNTRSGNNLIGIEDSFFSDNFVERVKKIVNSLVTEVLNDRKAAHAFSLDSEGYLSSKEIALKIELSDQERALLLAYSDEDIRRAVQKMILLVF